MFRPFLYPTLWKYFVATIFPCTQYPSLSIVRCGLPRESFSVLRPIKHPDWFRSSQVVGTIIQSTVFSEKRIAKIDNVSNRYGWWQPIHIHFHSQRHIFELLRRIRNIEHSSSQYPGRQCILHRCLSHSSLSNIRWFSPQKYSTN